MPAAATWDGRASPVFLDALENGTEDEQYAALLALRLFGLAAQLVSGIANAVDATLTMAAREVLSGQFPSQPVASTEWRLS